MSDDVFNIVGTLQDEAFRVDEVVAEGGFAVVYRAYHQGFRAHVALKCLKVPRALDADKQQEFLNKFREEGELLFRLSAAIPQVVRPLHLGTLETDSQRFAPFIALEWLEGKTLDEFIRERVALQKPPLSLERTVRLLAPAARALERAHRFVTEAGTVSILHRDIKPENLFVSTIHGQPAIKIVDFGIGKVKSVTTQLVGHASVNETALNAFTPAYAAPEQWLPKRFGQTGPWTDVWGFALTVVEVLTGKSPFEGDATALMGAALDEGERPTPGCFGIVLPSRVEAAFKQALAVDPKTRTSDVGTFWDVLEAEAGVTTTRVLEASSVLASDPPPPLVAASPGRARVDASPAAATVPDLQLGPALVSPNKKQVPVNRPGGPVSAAAEVPMRGGFRVDTDSLGALTGVGISGRAEPIRTPPRLESFHEQRMMSQARKGFFECLLGPARWVGVASAIMLADWLYYHVVGESLHLGPVRAFWIAGPIAGYAILSLIGQLMSDS